MALPSPLLDIGQPVQSWHWGTHEINEWRPAPWSGCPRHRKAQMLKEPVNEAGYKKTFGEDMKEGGLDEWMAVYESGLMAERYTEEVSCNVLNGHEMFWLCLTPVPGCLGPGETE